MVTAAQRLDGAATRRRAPAGTRRRALVSAALALAMLHLPLALGYGFLLRRSLGRLLEAGVLPAAEFLAPFPLHWPRMFALALFSVDVALWVALVSLLPLDDPAASVFGRARLRLRRRWLVAHAPVVPLVATLVGAHLHARALASTGAGALFFDVRRVASGVRLAGAWVEIESLLLISMTAIFLVHIVLLAGIARFWPWLRNALATLAAAWLLATASTFVLIPLGAGPLPGLARGALAEIDVACPRFDGSDLDTRIAEAFSAFHRTAADAPALREYPPWHVPRTITLPPALARLPAAGLPVVVDGAPAVGGLAAGRERRVPLRGGPVDLPLPPGCAAARVLKLDRALLAANALDALADAGSGPLRLAYAPRPGPRPSPVPRSPGPVLHLAGGEGPLPPAGVPQVVLPLPPGPDDEGSTVEPGSARAGDPWRIYDTGPAREHALPASPDGSGRLVLVPEAGALWDDLLHALAAAHDAGAREIWIVPAIQDSASSSAR